MNDGTCEATPPGTAITPPAHASASGGPTMAGMTTSRGDRLLLVVARLHRWASRHAQLPAPAAQLRLLSLISDLGPSRIGDLATADNSSQPTMTTQVKRLERLGYVTRSQDARDGRATVVTMTSAGARALQQARDARAEVVVPLLDGMSDEELATLDAALEILDARLAKQRTAIQP